jgi:arylsulfatase A-like enzyme
MTSTGWSRRRLLSSFTPLCFALRARGAPAKRPNILFILADDLGWKDLSCYGSTFHETPNIDRLAGSGMKFTCAYTAGTVCSPTRASIVTGRYPARVGITDYLPGLPSEGRKLRTPLDLDQLPLDQVTIGEVLRQLGYQTFYAGKWHLGARGFSPLEQGFDVYVDEGTGKQGINSPRYTQGFCDFLEGRDPKKPFFAFVSYNEPHTPITAREPWIRHFEEKAARLPPAPAPIRERDGQTRMRQDNAPYASMLAMLDDQVGKLTAKLAELGLEKESVVVFTSDNGGLSTLKEVGPTCNLPLRAGKGWIYEGGIRVPLIVRAPGITSPGSTCGLPLISTDYFATLVDIAGGPPLPELHKDGQSVLPLLRGRSGSAPRTFYWHYPHYHGSTWAPGGGIRSGKWKLIEFFEERAVELYDLEQDPGERRNLAASSPAMVRQLRSSLAAWRQEVGAAMPVPY